MTEARIAEGQIAEGQIAEGQIAEGQITEGQIAVDDPAADDVLMLLGRHLALMRSISPPEDVHALDAAGLAEPAVTFFSYRRDGRLLAVGALKELGGGHGELKSMHTAEAARGRGIGKLMLTHIVQVARARGYRRLSLETGSMDAFRPARSLYEAAGFTYCDPFGDYRPSANSAFMTRQL